MIGQRGRSALAAVGALAGGALLAREVLGRATEISLAERTVLIVGGSRGFALLLAQRFAAEGARVAICARDADALQRAADWMAERGHDVMAVTCDASDAEQVRDLVGRVEGRLGPVEVLVNNAALMQVGDVSRMTLDDFHRALDSGFWATLVPTLEVLPGMRERRWGRIVNITSIGGRVPGPHLAPYTAAKFAATGLSEALRIELARDNVGVTTVVPWFMRTGSYLNAIYKEPVESEFTWFALGASLPLVSIDAQDAAARVIQAVKRGEADVALGWPAWLAQRVHGLAPGLTTGITAAVTRFLPRGQPAPAVDGELGHEAQTRVPAAVELATAWGREAAEELNERQSTPGRSTRPGH